MASTTLGTVTLDGDGNSFIAETSVRKEAIITPLPLGTLDSDETLVFDFSGCIQTFNIRGVFIGSTAAACKTFIDSIKALIQGNQTPAQGYPLSYVDDFQGTVKVKIMDVECIKEAGEPLVVRWTVKVVQASEDA